jgi:hypothetical protein
MAAVDSVRWRFFKGVDRVRHLQGALRDAPGLGPIGSEYETVFSEPGVTPRRYGGGRRL